MKNRLAVAVCDDDMPFLDEEREMISKILRDTGIDFDIDAFSEPAEFIGTNKKYDIVFLDVEMKGMTGIEAADKIHGEHKDTLIFFVTNYEGYMDEALNKHAFRFWVKPLNAQRLAYGLESAIREISRADAALSVVIGKRLEKIAMHDIIYVYAKNKITGIVTIHGEYNAKEPLKNIVSRLSPGMFCMSHASYYVNLEYVVKYTRSEVICRYGGKTYEAYMSKRKYSEFALRFMRWVGEHV